MSTIPTWFNLKVGARRRLEALRAAAIKEGSNWRSARASTFADYQAYYSTLDQGFNDNGRGGKTPVWYTFREEFRNEKYADECGLRSINHTGWYCDEFGEAQARGIVASLPHGKFLAGYELTEGGMRTWFADIFTEERDAALMADEHARVIAESEQEYNAKGSEALALQDTVEEKLARLRELIVLRHRACLEYVRDEIAETIEAIRDARRELATTYKDFL